MLLYAEVRSLQTHRAHVRMIPYMCSGSTQLTSVLLYAEVRSLQTHRAHVIPTCVVEALSSLAWLFTTPQYLVPSIYTLIILYSIQYVVYTLISLEY